MESRLTITESASTKTATDHLAPVLELPIRSFVPLRGSGPSRVEPPARDRNCIDQIGDAHDHLRAPSNEPDSPTNVRVAGAHLPSLPPRRDEAYPGFVDD